MPKMDEQQEIELHEQEIKALLVRVLKEPLLPLSARLDDLVGDVKELQEQIVQHLSGMSAGISEDVEKRIRRLNSSIDSRLKDVESLFRSLLSNGLTQATEANSGALETMRVWLVQAGQQHREVLAAAVPG